MAWIWSVFFFKIRSALIIGDTTYLKHVEGVGRVVTLKKLSVLIMYSITEGVVTRQKIQEGRGWGATEAEGIQPKDSGQNYG